MNQRSATPNLGHRGQVLPAALVGRDPDPRVLLAAALAGTALAVLVLGVEQGAPLVRAGAALLALDIGAGLVSNASRSTRSFWTTQSVPARTTFVVVHVTAYPAALVLLVGTPWLRGSLIGAVLVKTVLFAVGSRRVG